MTAGTRAWRALPYLLGVLVFGVAVGVRWQQLPFASALGDAMGPWWAAARPELVPTPHAPPYGPLLTAPYQLIVRMAGSLWSAVAAMQVLHALVAPLALALVLRIRPGAWPAALVAGLAAALDPGLLDTARSGAEGYLAAVAIGGMVVALAGPVAGRWPLVALGCFVAAVHNHPLALAAGPLLCTLPKTRKSMGGAAIATALLLWHVAGLLGQAPGVDVATDAAVGALAGWGQTGRWSAGLVSLGLGVGAMDRRTRPLAICTGAALVLLLLGGAALGYLRDHHIRLLTVPALGGLAALGPWALLGVLLLRPPSETPTQESQLRRPGTLGLTHQLTDRVLEDAGPRWIVDGAWTSGGAPAAEPGAILLDAAMRGTPVDQIGPGGQVYVVASGRREHADRIPDGLTSVAGWDGWALRVGSADEVRVWSARLCETLADAGAQPPRLGGAWDGIAALRQDAVAAEMIGWWGCVGR